MTDKLIIIDGVDVSGCEFYKHTLKRETSPKWCIATHINYGDGCRYKGYCYNFPYCSYKMNKRLNEPVTTKDKKEDLKVKIKQLSKIVECSYDENKRRHEQLKRKEQECERLKKDTERWKSNFNGKVSAIGELLEQLDQLKVKNEELKKVKNHIENNRKQKADKLMRIEKLITACSTGYTDEFIQELLVILHEPEPSSFENKYKTTLAEIKEITKKTLNMVDYKTYFKRDNKSLKQEGFKALNEILQKISECEGNDETNN